MPKIEAHLKIIGRFDPDRVTASLGTAPTRSWRAGERLGESIVIFDDDGWRLTVGPFESTDATEQLQQLLSVVSPFEANLLEIKEMLSLDLMVTLTQYVCGGEPSVAGLYLDQSMVRWLNRLNAELDFDVMLLDYPEPD